MSFWSEKPKEPTLKKDGTLYADAKFSDILHMWVRQKQKEYSGRGSLSFKGPDLYSYGAHIARVYRRQAVVLISPYSWSQTTSAHCGYASYGARREGYAPYHFGPTREVMRDRGIDEVINYQERIVNGHKTNAYWRWACMQDKIKEINEMLAEFGEKPLPALRELNTGMSFKLRFNDRLKLIKREAVTRKLTGKSTY